MPIDFILRALLLTAIAATAGAQDIAPRNADTIQARQAETIQPRQVQPRAADPVQPRYAPSIQSRPAETMRSYEAPTVQPRPTPTVQDTAVKGTSPNAWQWMRAGDTGIAGDGVARGSQLKNVRCAGVTCRVYQDTAGAWTIRAEGGFPEATGRTLEVILMNTQTQGQEGNSRTRGIFSDGSFWDQLDSGRLPAGSYAVFYRLPEQDQVLAALTFDVLKHETSAAASGNQRGTTANDPYASQRAQDAARQNQRCLAMAATNPDVRCVP